MRKPDYNIPTHDGNAFYWHGNEGSCEASDLGPERRHARIWVDSVDFGFYVHSPKTGISKVFLYEAEHRDNEGEVTETTYVSYPDPALRVRVYND